jgi:hypothetical protein
MIMKSKLVKLTWPALLGGLLVLTGCGGGGGGGGGGGVTYSGSTSPATVTATNAEEIGTTATEAATNTIAAGNTPFGVAISDNSSNSVRQQAKDIVKRFQAELQQADNLPVGVTYTSDDLNAEFGENLFCGGTVDGPANIVNADSGTVTFHDMCFDLGYGGHTATLDGTVTFSYTESGDTYTDTTTYKNLTVTFNGETYTLNGTEKCTGNYATSEYSCSDLYNGADGKTYQVSNSDYYGDSVNGYYITATFYHPTYGYVNITTSSPILFNCTNGYPSAGTVNFSGAGGSSGTITFHSDCSGYDGTYNTGTETGTFSGNWPA